MEMGDIHLPDLQTLPPFDLRLVANQRRGERLIRFSNSVWNSGRGVLELRGRHDPQNKTVEVTQYLYGFDQVLVKGDVGEFDYHPEHEHWHWEDFSIYKIWTVEPDGDLGKVVVSSGKVGFCLLDTSPMDDEQLQERSHPMLETAQRRRYGQCSWRRQGITPGWLDTYFFYTPGQAMDVSDLSNGIYALRSMVDPDGLIYESNKNNNSALVYFTLYGDRFHVIGEGLSDYLPPALME